MLKGTKMKTWKITKLNTYPEMEGMPNFVCSAGWQVSEIADETMYALNGATAFRLDPDAPFTPYSELTEAQILEWVWASMGEEGKASAEADVQAQIEYAQKKIETPALPWGA